jgi:hypothetical protein
VHQSLEALGGLPSPAGSCVWHVVGLQRSVREWAIRLGWSGRPVRREQAQGALVIALGVLAAHLGYGEAKRPPESAHRYTPAVTVVQAKVAPAPAAARSSGARIHVKPRRRALAMDPKELFATEIRV